MRSPAHTRVTAEAKEHPELRIEGYVGDQRVLTRVFSADRSQDQLLLQVDDGAITADMQDATRVWFAVCDRYGASVPCLDGEVTVEMDGPAEIIGDSSFVLQDTGGVGAVWVRSNSKASGRAVIRATHPRFGSKSVKVELHSVKGA